MSGGKSSGGGAGAESGGISNTGGAATGGSASGGGGQNATGGATGGKGGAASTGGKGAGGNAGATSGGSAGASTGGNAGTTGGSGGAASGCLEFGTPTQVGKIDSAITPPSGMVASRVHPGVLYVQEDAGGKARFHAIDTTGKTLGEYTLTGGKATDWEDIAVGKGPGKADFVFIGDFGDNSVNRTEIQIVRVPEPNVSATQAAVQQAITDFQTLRFTYPDGAHNAETLMVDPVTDDMIIVTKETSGNSSVFRAPATAAADTPMALEKIGSYQFPGSGQGVQVGGGDISPTGDRVIIRTYTAIYLWPRAPGATLGPTFATMPKTLPSATEPQSEGLTFAADGLSWYSAGEQSPNLYQGKATCP
jgi:hypothetical protein